jgi:hypothetical protein
MRRKHRTWPGLLLVLLWFGGGLFIAACTGHSTPPIPAHRGILSASDPRWLGGDGAMSVPMTEGRRLWLFGDTWILGPVGKPAMVSNTIGLQRGPCEEPMEAFWSQRDERPGPAFLAEGGEGWLWPSGGLRLEGGLYLFMHQLVRRAPGGAWDFAVKRTEWLRVSNPGAPPARWVVERGALPWSGEHLLAGASPVPDGPWVLFFATRPARHGREVIPQSQGLWNPVSLRLGASAPTHLSSQAGDALPPPLSPSQKDSGARASPFLLTLDGCPALTGTSRSGTRDSPPVTDGLRRELIVARIAREDLETLRMDQWSFLSEREGIWSWVSDPGEASGLFQGVGTEFTVARELAGDRWVCVYSPGGISTDFVLRTAPDLRGPWGDPIPLGRCEEAEAVQGVYCYGAKLHPECLEDPRSGLWITYSVNTRDGRFPEGSLAKPRWVWIER